MKGKKYSIICSPQLGISPESNLGGEVYDREMLIALDRIGVETLIILPLGKKHPPLRHAKFYFLPTPFAYPPLVFNLLILPYLVFLRRKYHFDILRVHSPYFVGPAALLFKFFNPNLKIVASYLHIEPNNLLDNYIDKLLINSYSLITTISQATKEDIVRKYDVNPDKIIVIPCGVDPKYKPLPKNKELISKYELSGKKVILFMGQLIARKNIPFLFKVTKRLPRNYVLMVCGSGPLKEKLKRIAQDRVIFTGKIPENEKVDYYNLADVFVYPSLLEGFGLSVLEALACGKIVLANDLKVFREIKNNNLILSKLEAKMWAAILIKPFEIRSVSFNQNRWSEIARTYIESL